MTLTRQDHLELAEKFLAAAGDTLHTWEAAPSRYHQEKALLLATQASAHAALAVAAPCGCGKPGAP